MFVGCLTQSQQQKKGTMFYIFSIMNADDLVTGTPWASTNIIFCEKLYEYTCTLISLLKH